MKHLFLIVFVLSILCHGTTFASVPYDYVKIQVNDHVITNNEIEIRILELKRLNKIQAISSLDSNEIRLEAENQLVEELLLDIRADELMIFLTDDDLDEELEHFRKQRKLSQMEFDELLEQQKIGLVDFRKTYLRQLRRNRVITQEVRSAINVSEDEMRKEYESDIGLERHIRARHILLRVKPQSTVSDIAAIKEKALELKKRIKAGESFQALADLYSEDPSVKRNHGDLGFFKKQDMVEAFSKVAFALQKGQISDPVKTPFGFHIIEVLEEKKEPRESFDKVKDKLRQQRLQKLYTEKYKQYIDKLKKKANIIKY